MAQRSMTLPELLTIEETKEAIEEEAVQGKILSQRIKGSWRTILLQQAGALADDDTLPELLANIYAERGCPEEGELKPSLQAPPIPNLQSPIPNLKSKI